MVSIGLCAYLRTDLSSTKHQLSAHVTFDRTEEGRKNGPFCGPPGAKSDGKWTFTRKFFPNFFSSMAPQDFRSLLKVENNW